MTTEPRPRPSVPPSTARTPRWRWRSPEDWSRWMLEVLEREASVKPTTDDLATEAASAAEREPDMATTPESISPVPDVWDGIHYDVKLGVSFHRDAEGSANPFGVGMWTADMDIADGVSVTAAGQTPAEALGRLASRASELAKPMPSDD